MNKYEIMFIVKPDVEEEARNTLIVGNTFEHLDLWVDFFFVSIWFIFDEKENITIENKKETIPSLIGIVLGILIQYFI